MRNFAYVRPSSVSEALEVVHENGAQHPRFLAGGTTLVDLMRLDVLQADLLVDITSIRELQAFDTSGKSELVFGAQLSKMSNKWLTELAPIADAALVPKTVASGVNVPEQSGREIIDTLVDALRPKTYRAPFNQGRRSAGGGCAPRMASATAPPCLCSVGRPQTNATLQV